ncbi:MAG TPA: BamA/TamA family outer membrane protein [Polyangiales bacterium]|jgi:hypothetical protein|nr:BamA/TamA family outer membrane protein [Polyangiales bacterium]
MASVDATTGQAARSLQPIAFALLAPALLLATTSVHADDKPAARTEIGALPLLGGDSDLGFGGGALMSLTRVEPGSEPYRWQLELSAVVTFKRPDTGWQMPYQDAYVLLNVPNLIRDRLRLELRPSYTRELNQAYYGIGNATPAPEHGPAGQPSIDYFQFERVHPTLSVRFLFKLGGSFYLQLGNSLTYNAIEVHPGSKLDIDRHDPRLRSFFGTLRPHFVDFFEYTLFYDTRDNEVSPLRGMYHQVRLRLSPGGTDPLPYRYGQVNATARFYVTPVHRWLTIAARVVGDVLFGDPPFYELARFEDTFALGGVRGVRGVPGQRYYGKIKLFGNLESRSELTSFSLFGLPCTLSGVLFIDAGRLWSDWHADPELDGHGLGLKLGLGGGLRLQQGTAFVVRGDLAWSPDARPIGAYVTAGQIF